MGTDLWLKDDIRNILVGVDLANAHIASHLDDVATTMYRQGFRAALIAAAISFGIPPQEVCIEWPPKPTGHALSLTSRSRA
jgi:hypothetical protein